MSENKQSEFFGLLAEIQRQQLERSNAQRLATRINNQDQVDVTAWTDLGDGVWQHAGGCRVMRNTDCTTQKRYKYIVVGAGANNETLWRTLWEAKVAVQNQSAGNNE